MFKGVIKILKIIKMGYSGGMQANMMFEGAISGFVSGGTTGFLSGAALGFFVFIFYGERATMLMGYETGLLFAGAGFFVGVLYRNLLVDKFNHNYVFLLNSLLFTIGAYLAMFAISAILQMEAISIGGWGMAACIETGELSKLRMIFEEIVWGIYGPVVMLIIGMLYTIIFEFVWRKTGL